VKTFIYTALVLVLATPVAQAETRTYGRVDLGGLARDTDWPYNAPGLSYAMVCNVNGPDGFLSVHWVRVIDGHRTHTKDGVPQDFKPLTVSGWAHDGFLCSFID